MFGQERFGVRWEKGREGRKEKILELTFWKTHLAKLPK